VIGSGISSHHPAIRSGIEDRVHLAGVSIARKRSSSPVAGDPGRPGAQAVVVAPASLREEMRQSMLELAARYAEPLPT
jgi:hypothetical protein